MKNVLKILAMVGKILVYVLVVLGSLLSLVTAYIVLAPDDLPKPFRLSYMYPTPTMSVTTTAGAEAATPTESMETKPGAGVMVDTGTKIINLAQNGGNKYIRIDVVLEFAQPIEPTPAKKAASSEGDTAAVTAATELTNEINARLPMVNDTVITLLSSKTFDELYTSTGKEALRGELMQKLQAMMPEYKIIGVYFTEFVVE
jgi:flagellar protein FliL